MKTTIRTLWNSLLVVFLGTLLAGQAHGQIFVTSSGGTIGEYNYTTGATVNASLVSGLSHPLGITASGGNLFVTNTGNGTSGNGTIGVYDANTGATVNASLVSGLSFPWGIAVSGANLLVANNIGPENIAEYNATTGATVNASLVSGLNGPDGIAVSGGNLFVANSGFGSGTTVGKYNATTGHTVNASFISGLNGPTGIAVSGANLFVANINSGTIGKYNASTGATVNASFISGLSDPSGIAVSGANLFVVNTGNGTIGEYNATTGATVNASLVSGLSSPQAIAVVVPPSSTWMQLSPGGLTFPLFRGGSTTVYDPTSNELILFSGASDDEAAGNPKLNDVWILTNANGLGGAGAWSNLIANGAAGSPPGRENHSAVYDAANNRMIIFGGCEGQCEPVGNDVWVLSNANGIGGTPTWAQLSPTGGPPGPRQGHQTVYDPNTNSMIVWAGQNGGGQACSPDAFSDVWVLSHANGLGGTPNWTQLSPTGGPPAGRYFSTAVYDSANNIMTVFGGFGLVGATCEDTNAVWALSNANGTGGTPVWSNLIAQGAASSPPNREGQVAVYQPSSNTMTIFGGDGATALLGDTWVLSHANGLGGTPVWTKLSTTGAPPTPSARWNNGGVDTENASMIMFGGSSSEGPLWSTWVLTNANGL